MSDFKAELEEANRKIEEQARVHREEMADLESLYNLKILRTEDQVAVLVDQVKAQKDMLDEFREDFREMLDRQVEQDRVIQDFFIASRGQFTINAKVLAEDSPFLKVMKDADNR